MRWRIETAAGALYPTKYHGVAYDRVQMAYGCRVVWYPVPVNLVLRWSRAAWWRLRIHAPGRWAARGCERCGRVWK